MGHGIARCFCDKVRFSRCPGHGPSGLKGIATRSKPVGKQSNVDRAMRWVRHLRPDADDDTAARHALSKKRWQVSYWHFGDAGLRDEAPKPGCAKVIRSSPSVPAEPIDSNLSGASEAEEEEVTLVASAPKDAERVIAQPVAALPVVGDRLAVKGADAWVGGVVTAVESCLAGRRSTRHTKILVDYL